MDVGGFSALAERAGKSAREGVGRFLESGSGALALALVVGRAWRLAVALASYRSRSFSRSRSQRCIRRCRYSSPLFRKPSRWAGGKFRKSVMLMSSPR